MEIEIDDEEGSEKEEAVARHTHHHLTIWGTTSNTTHNIDFGDLFAFTLVHYCLGLSNQVE